MYDQKNSRFSMDDLRRIVNTGRTQSLVTRRK